MCLCVPRDVHILMGVLCSLQESSERSPESPDVPSETSLTEEYYQASSGGLSPPSSSSSFSHINVQPAQLVFNCAPSAPSPSSSQSVCVTNRTKGKVRYHIQGLLCTCCLTSHSSTQEGYKTTFPGRLGAGYASLVWNKSVPSSFCTARME